MRYVSVVIGAALATTLAAGCGASEVNPSPTTSVTPSSYEPPPTEVIRFEYSNEITPGALRRSAGAEGNSLWIQGCWPTLKSVNSTTGDIVAQWKCPDGNTVVVKSVLEQSHYSQVPVVERQINTGMWVSCKGTIADSGKSDTEQRPFDYRDYHAYIRTILKIDQATLLQRSDCKAAYGG